MSDERPYTCATCGGSGRLPDGGGRTRACWLCDGTGYVRNREESRPLPERR